MADPTPEERVLRVWGQVDGFGKKAQDLLADEIREAEEAARRKENRIPWWDRLNAEEQGVIEAALEAYANDEEDEDRANLADAIAGRLMVERHRRERDAKAR